MSELVPKVEHDREGFARAWLRAQELSWVACLLKD